MSQLPNSPIEQDKPGEVSLPLEAVEAMCMDIDLEELARDPKGYIEYLAPRFIFPWPDWFAAAYNCKSELTILSVAIHTFLMDWKPEAKA